MKIEEGRSLLAQAGIDEDKLVVHAPYIINLCNAEKSDIGKTFLRDELRRTSAFGANKLVLHPGCHVGLGVEIATQNLAKALLEVLAEDDSGVTICLETMAGKGSEIGVGFQWFASFFAAFPLSERLGVCLDTCHCNDAGMDVSEAGRLLDEFDRVIGLEKLRVVHLNDSKSPRGVHKDRHENLGYGTIGFTALRSYVTEPRLSEIPLILETPYVGEKPPYALEIAMLRSGEYIENWKDTLK